MDFTANRAAFKVYSIKILQFGIIILYLEWEGCECTV